MIRVPLEVAPRSETGKGFNRRLRVQGRIPAVLYGRGADSLLLSINDHTFVKATNKMGDDMVLFELTAETADLSRELAVIRELQRDPLTDRIIHVDMLRVDENRPLDVDVSVRTDGAPVGVLAGGVLEQVSRSVRLRCLPDLIPSHLVVEVDALEIGDGIYVRDIELAEGVEMLSPLGDVVCHVIIPRKVEEEEVVEEGEEGAEEGEEGAEEGEKTEEADDKGKK